MHRWKYDGTNEREFPWHGAIDADGNPKPVIGPGETVHSEVLAPFDTDPLFTRLDKPARSSAAPAETAKPEPEPEPAAAEPTEEPA